MSQRQIKSKFMSTMKIILSLTFVISLFGFVSGLGLSGMATTTRYCDWQMGACGCTEFPHLDYTAAGSTSLFGDGSWCGSGCGKCFKLTAQGWSPDGKGGTGTVIVQITNWCP